MEKIEHEELTGLDFANDELFFTHTWWDETSQFDPKAKWVPGGEYYEREYKARVPIAFRDSEIMIDRFLLLMQEDYNDTSGFWVK